MQSRFQNGIQAVGRTSFHESGREPRRSFLRSRLSGPGGIYNLGNVIALFSGFALKLYEDQGQSGVFETLQSYLVGNSGATFLTLAMILFLISGEVYHHAAKPGARTALLPWADFISGLAAISLTAALLWLGEATAAWVAGVMLVAGKLGCAALPAFVNRDTTRVERLLRVMVAASRAPSLVALGLTVLPALRGEVAFDLVLLPLIMILCFLLWLWADLLLLFRHRSALGITVRTDGSV